MSLPDMHFDGKLSPSSVNDLKPCELDARWRPPCKPAPTIVQGLGLASEWARPHPGRMPWRAFTTSNEAGICSHLCSQLQDLFQFMMEPRLRIELAEEGEYLSAEKTDTDRNNDKKTLLVIVVKTPGSVEKDQTQFERAMIQLYGYMTVASCIYGVLTTYDTWWSVKMLDGKPGLLYTKDSYGKSQALMSFAQLLDASLEDIKVILYHDASGCSKGESVCFHVCYFVDILCVSVWVFIVCCCLTGQWNFNTTLQWELEVLQVGAPGTCVYVCVRVGGLHMQCSGCLFAL